jgi:hypothetical protein
MQVGWHIVFHSLGDLLRNHLWNVSAIGSDAIRLGPNGQLAGSVILERIQATKVCQCPLHSSEIPGRGLDKAL